MSYSNKEIREKIIDELLYNFPSLEVKKILSLRYIKTYISEKIGIDFFDFNDVHRTCVIPYTDFGINLDEINFENFDNDERMQLFNYGNKEFVSLPIIGIKGFIDILGRERFKVQLYNNSNYNQFGNFNDKNIRVDIFYLNYGYNTIVTEYIKKDYTDLNLNLIDSII